MVENAYLERATGRRGGRPTPPIAHSLQFPSYELIGQGWGQCHTKRQEPDVGNGECHSVSAKAATRLSIYSRQAYAPTPTKSAVCKKVRALWVRFRNPSLGPAAGFAMVKSFEYTSVHLCLTFEVDPRESPVILLNASLELNNTIHSISCKLRRLKSGSGMGLTGVHGSSSDLSRGK